MVSYPPQREGMLSALAMLLLGAVAGTSGCRSMECGWHTYRFAKTKVDVTQPNLPDASSPEPVSPTSNALPMPELNDSSSVTSSKPPLRLVGYSRTVDSASSQNEASNTVFSNDNQPTVQIAEPNDPIMLLSDESTKLPSPSGPSAKSNLFDLPSDFPGGDAAPLQLPRMDAGESAVQRRSIVDSLFESLPVAKADSIPFDDEGRVITLTELQDIAVENNPSLQQAVARVEAARGRMIQAGLYPNPTIGYEGDTLGTADTNGYNGGFVTQQIVTAGKLQLAQTSAMMEMRASEYDLRTTRIEVATAVRRLYFSILVEQEKIRLYQSIQRLSQEVYEAQRTLVAGGESAVYEPLQLRVLAVLASNNVLTAKNALAAYWRQLSASIGVPDLPACKAYGSIEMEVPQIELQQAFDLMLARNADLTAAQFRITGNQYNLRLQRVTPIPDVTVYSALQRDSTSPLTPNRTTFNMQVSVPVPVFNRNQGNISTARATLVDADRNYTTVRNQLQSDLADAYNRYVTSQAIVTNYRDIILPDQVRVYRATYSRFRIAGEEVDFAQIIVTQQTLVQAVVSYLDAVTAQWQSTVDVARLLQVDDLFTMNLSQQ